MIVSSHVLHEVERMAPRVVVLVNGRLVAEGETASIRALIADRPRSVRIEAGAQHARPGAGTGRRRPRRRSPAGRRRGAARDARSRRARPRAAGDRPRPRRSPSPGSSPSATTSRASTRTCTPAPGEPPGDPPRDAVRARRWPAAAGSWRWLALALLPASSRSLVTALDVVDDPDRFTARIVERMLLPVILALMHRRARRERDRRGPRRRHDPLHRRDAAAALADHRRRLARDAPSCRSA